MHMLAYAFLVFALALRLGVALEVLPYPFNFAAVGAALLFFGAYVVRRQWWAALTLVIATDLVLTRFVYGLAFQFDILATFAWYGAILWVGSLLRQNAGALRLAGAALATSVSFFLVSNFAVWALTDLYPRTWAGLVTSYSLAVPFFRSTVAGDMFFVAFFFGMAALMESVARSRRRVEA